MSVVGQKAIVLNNKGNMHSFPKGTEIKFLGINNGWHLFENEKNGIRQYLSEENFEWIETNNERNDLIQ